MGCCMTSQYEYEQLKLLDVDVYKGRIYAGHCPLCHYGDRFVISKEYKPPEGLDPNILLVKCTTCEKDYYVVRSKK